MLKPLSTTVTETIIVLYRLTAMKTENIGFGNGFVIEESGLSKLLVQ